MVSPAQTEIAAGKKRVTGKMRQNIIILVLILLMAMSAVSQSDNLLLINADIHDDDGIIHQGEKIRVDSDIIINSDNHENIVDITIMYTMKDNAGKIYTTLTETKGTIMRLESSSNIIIPLTTTPGIYTLEVEAFYDDIYRKTSLQFEVVERDDKTIEQLKATKNTINILTVAIAGISVFCLIVFYYEQKKFKQLESLLRKRKD